MLDNADVVALVHDQDVLRPQVAEALPGAAAGQARRGHRRRAAARRSPASTTRTRWPKAARSATSTSAAATTSTSSTPAARPACPRACIWRHEDVWRTLGGGINFMTGEPLPDEFAQAEMGKVTGGMVRLCLAPLIHGNAQWAGADGAVRRRHRRAADAVRPGRGVEGRRAPQGQRHRADRRRDGAADDRGVHRRAATTCRRVYRDLQQRGAVLAEREERVPRSAAQRR